MKSLKIIMITVLFTLIFSVGVSAKEDTFRTSVEKLLILMKLNHSMDQEFQQMKEMLQQQFQQMNIPQEQSALIDKYFTKLYNLIKEEKIWDKLKEDYIQIYMSVYTEKEVQELITFYESPIGQKMIEKTPVINQQVMTINQKYFVNIMPKFMAIVQEIISEAKNKSEENDKTNNNN